MSAVVIIERYTGTGPGTTTDITGINTVSQTKDEHTTNSLDSLPIHIPFEGYNYSYWISTRLRILTSPALSIGNIRWYTDGINSFGQGVSCFGQTASVGDNDGYRQATGTDGITGTQLSLANHDGLDSEPVNVFSFNSSSPKIINGEGSAIGPFGDFLVYQMRIDNTVIPGISTQEMFVWAFDES